MPGRYVHLTTKNFKLMNKLKFLSYFFSILIIFSCQDVEQQADFPKFDFQPNILWITCEDMSPHLGCYGDSTARTTYIDNLSSEGIIYTNA